MNGGRDRSAYPNPLHLERQSLMILGVFGGRTPKSFESRIQRLAIQRARIDVDLSQAVADRAAAISELNRELAELASHRASL